MTIKKFKNNLLSTTDVARILGVSWRTVFRYIQDKKLRATKIGQWRIAAHDLASFVRQQQNKQTRRIRYANMYAPATNAATAPLFLSRIPAGFPSPADDFIEDHLNLHELLIKNTAATFFLKAQGESMRDAGINSGDILVVDRSKNASNNSVVIAVVDGELTVKRLKINGKKIALVPENNAFKPIAITTEHDFVIWGVVTSVIHQFTH